MTLESVQQQGEIDDPFASLSPYEFVLLTTFRKSGGGLPTAMWFAHERGKHYMVTGRTTARSSAFARLAVSCWLPAT